MVIASLDVMRTSSNELKKKKLIWKCIEVNLHKQAKILKAHSKKLFFSPHGSIFFSTLLENSVNTIKDIAIYVIIALK